MIRAPIGSASFWSQWGKFRLETISDEEITFQTPSANPVYRPQYVFNNGGCPNFCVNGVKGHC